MKKYLLRNILISFLLCNPALAAHSPENLQALWDTFNQQCVNIHELGGTPIHNIDGLLQKMTTFKDTLVATSKRAYSRAQRAREQPAYTPENIERRFDTEITQVRTGYAEFSVPLNHYSLQKLNSIVLDCINFSLEKKMQHLKTLSSDKLLNLPINLSGNSAALLSFLGTEGENLRRVASLPHSRLCLYLLSYHPSYVPHTQLHEPYQEFYELFHHGLTDHDLSYLLRGAPEDGSLIWFASNKLKTLIAKYTTTRRSQNEGFVAFYRRTLEIK